MADLVGHLCSKAKARISSNWLRFVAARRPVIAYSIITLRWPATMAKATDVPAVSACLRERLTMPIDRLWLQRWRRPEPPPNTTSTIDPNCTLARALHCAVPWWQQQSELIQAQLLLCTACFLCSRLRVSQASRHSLIWQRRCHAILSTHPIVSITATTAQAATWLQKVASTSIVTFQILSNFLMYRSQLTFFSCKQRVTEMWNTVTWLAVGLVYFRHNSFFNVSFALVLWPCIFYLDRVQCLYVLIDRLCNHTSLFHLLHFFSFHFCQTLID